MTFFNLRGQYADTGNLDNGERLVAKFFTIFLLIDAVKSESPSSGWHKGKSDDDVVFAAMAAARWRLRLNSVYSLKFRPLESQGDLLLP